MLLFFFFSFCILFKLHFFGWVKSKPSPDYRAIVLPAHTRFYIDDALSVFKLETLVQVEAELRGKVRVEPQSSLVRIKEECEAVRQEIKKRGDS